MKKLSSEAKRFQIKRQIYCQLKAVKRKSWLRAKHRSVYGNDRVSIRISAPEIIGTQYTEIRSELLKFLARLRNETKLYSHGDASIIIDFSDTKKIYADGMILIYGEIHRLSHYFNRAKIRIRESSEIGQEWMKKKKVNQVLCQLGLFEFLGNPIKISSTAHDVVHWRHIRGRLLDRERYDSILLELEQLINGESLTGLDVGLVEAIDNIMDHAYEGIRSDGLEINEKLGERRYWYLFAQVRDNEKHRDVNVALLDLGIGIPNRLADYNPGWTRQLKELFRHVPIPQTQEGNAIKYAVTYGKSSTGNSYRGKGLPHLVSTVQAVKDAKLTILSNRGVYQYVDGKIWQPFDFSDSILGTLIYWRFPISRRKRIDIITEKMT